MDYPVIEKLEELESWLGVQEVEAGANGKVLSDAEAYAKQKVEQLLQQMRTRVQEEFIRPDAPPEDPHKKDRNKPPPKQG